MTAVRKTIHQLGLAGGVAFAMAAAALAVPAGAQAAARSAEVARVSAFHLTISPAPGHTGATNTADLGCEPPVGNVANPAAACAQLAAADGRIERIPPESGACYLIYAPVRVTAVGYWHGRPRAYSRIFANRCVASRDTGGKVFAFQSH